MGLYGNEKETAAYFGRRGYGKTVRVHKGNSVIEMGRILNELTPEKWIALFLAQRINRFDLCIFRINYPDNGIDCVFFSRYNH